MTTSMKKFLFTIIVIILTFRVTAPSQAIELSADLAATKDALEQELQTIEAQIAEYEQELATTQHAKQTLANKIKELKIKQAYLRSQIKVTTVKINQLTSKLTATEQAIANKTARVDRLRKQLLVIIRTLGHKDHELLVNLASSGGLNQIFDTLQNYTQLSNALGRVLSETRVAKKDLEHQAAVYDQQKDDAEHLLALQSIQQRELGDNLVEHNSLLKETKGKESNYQALLADTKKRAAQIRSRIYELFGGVKQISFGEAVTIAEWVSKQIGIRSSYLLAILTQESNLGKNVGTCNRPGDPAEKSWRKVMKPERDYEPFLKITNELGLDPDTTPISCPLKDKRGKQFGWGGAMGPAQFIPSTWMGYKDKISALTGKTPANPWDIRDAFIASAMKLAKDGANGTYDGEWKAALRYFSGSTNKKYRFYADNVMSIANRYQKDIDELKN